MDIIRRQISLAWAFLSPYYPSLIEVRQSVSMYIFSANFSGNETNDCLARQCSQKSFHGNELRFTISILDFLCPFQMQKNQSLLKRKWTLFRRRGISYTFLCPFLLLKNQRRLIKKIRDYNGCRLCFEEEESVKYFWDRV